MKISLSLSALLLALTLGLAAADADAARRFGGGSSIGKQRPAPTMKEAAPAKPAQAAPTTPSTTTPAAPAPKPSFRPLRRPRAGLGLGAARLLFSSGLGGLGALAMVLLAGLAFMAWRAFARGRPLPRKRTCVRRRRRRSLVRR
jgi:hypothetical protein